MVLEVEKIAERERRRMEIRESIIAKSKLPKKGFMTPERKKSLRNFLRRQAILIIHQQQKEKEILRQKIIAERCGPRKQWNELSEAALQELCKEYQNRIYDLNEKKWDLELSTSLKELEINEINNLIVDQRGKFVVPPLKKISKYQTQLEKMRQWTFKLAKLDMRGMLRPVKREIELDEKIKEIKPEWAAENKIAKTPTTPGFEKNREFDDWNKSSTSLNSSKSSKFSKSKEEINDSESGEEEEEAVAAVTAKAAVKVVVTEKDDYNNEDDDDDEEEEEEDDDDDENEDDNDEDEEK